MPSAPLHDGLHAGMQDNVHHTAPQALPELLPSQESALKEIHDQYLALRLDSQALAAAHPGKAPLHAGFLCMHHKLHTLLAFPSQRPQMARTVHAMAMSLWGTHPHACDELGLTERRCWPGYGFSTTFVRPTLWAEPFPASVALESVLPEDSSGMVGFREVPLSDDQVAWIATLVYSQKFWP